MKGDERILGEGDFVETVLKAAQENLDRKHEIKARGYTFDWLVKRVAHLLELEPKEMFMTEFNGVTVIKKANIYFDGKVTSRTVIFPDGSRKTLGIMYPGEYEFNTEAKEIMEIISGDLDVSLPEENGWKTVSDGESFEVPSQSKFGLKVKRLTDYCCSYIV